MAERLRNATSPYLRQHADNPVDWWEWGADAFAEAERRDVPVLLSIGYSTCHWCHVMAHESFEDPATAKQLNSQFVAIKVDREERPDVDTLYMTAAQALGNGGGWPLTVFLTPDRRPFYAGTYFPPEPRHGMPSFRQILDGVSRAWADNRDAVLSTGEQVRDLLAGAWAGEPSPSPDDDALTRAVLAVTAQHDPRNGGFGGAPKFPMSPALTFLLHHAALGGRADALNAAARTLNVIDEGGIHDHVAGGFARYAVDARWDIPHFEKMLTDNAQLLLLFAEMFAMTGRPGWARPARGIVAWLEREMRTEEGAFAAGLDADAAGVEGSFTIWTSVQIRAALADAGLPEEDAELAITHYGIGSGRGAHEGGYVPRVAVSVEELAAQGGTSPEDIRRRIDLARTALLAAREQRERPHRDDKAVTAWNGLAIGALARAAHLVGEPAWLDLAREVASAVLRLSMDDDGTLARSFSAGRRSGPGALDDYGALAGGLFALAAATGEARWREAGGRIVQRALELFGDEDTVLLRDSADPDLIVSPRDVTDSATPSGNALWADAAATWAVLTQDEELLERARGVAGAAAAEHEGHPLFAGFAFATAERLARPARELTLVGEADAVAELRAVALRRVAPRLVVAEKVTGGAGGDGEDESASRAGDVAMTADRPLPEGAAAAAYLCENYVCRAPVTTAETLAALLDDHPLSDV